MGIPIKWLFFLPCVYFSIFLVWSGLRDGIYMLTWKQYFKYAIHNGLTFLLNIIIIALWIYFFITL